MSLLGKLDKIFGVKRLESREAIGICITLKDIYVSQITERNGAPEVEALIKVPVGDTSGLALKPAELMEGFFAQPATWLEPIKKAVSSRQWKTKNVVVSLSPNFTIYRHFVMQDMARKYWKKAIPLQARKYIHYPFERATFDYYVYPFTSPLSKAKKLGIVFCLAPARVVATIEAGLKAIGLNLVALEPASLSVYRLFNHTDKEAVPGQGCLYANFTDTLCQFVFALNNVPLLLRDVEVQRSIGSHNHLEINNCLDFISKQLERNPFEDAVVVSDDADFWAPIVETEVKRHVREWKFSDIFGFKIASFPGMSPIGACLKFLNQKVVDIDLYRKNRSTDEEIRGITTIWKIVGIIGAALILWFCYVQTRAFVAASKFATSSAARETVADFAGLYAGQIEEKVRTTHDNARLLGTLVEAPASYTEKLSSLPDLLPAQMWVARLSLNYPYTVKPFKERNVLRIEANASTLEGVPKALQYGAAFTSAVEGSTAYGDICRNATNVDYPPTESASVRGAVAATKVILECSREIK